MLGNVFLVVTLPTPGGQGDEVPVCVRMQVTHAAGDQGKAAEPSGNTCRDPKRQMSPQPAIPHPSSPRYFGIQ